MSSNFLVLCGKNFDRFVKTSRFVCVRSNRGGVGLTFLYFILILEFDKVFFSGLSEMHSKFQKNMMRKTCFWRKFKHYVVFAPSVKTSPGTRRKIYCEMSKLVIPVRGQFLSTLLYFWYKYSFVKFDVSLYSALWTKNIHSFGHKLTTGLSELSWTCPESIFEEILGRVCGLKKLSEFWWKVFSCLPKKTQCKSQNCSLRARKENLMAIFGKKN